MRKFGSSILLPFDPEIEKTCRKNRKEKREAVKLSEEETMAEGGNQMVANGNTRALRDYALPMVNENATGIRFPNVQANTFEIKPSVIQMVQAIQFGGSASEDPNAHITNFIEICATFKYNGVTDDAIRLRLFLFSLRDKAKAWLNSVPAGSITTWNDLANKFLTKFFPPAKTAKIRAEITTFRQFENEQLYEGWERFEEMLRSCPHHGLPKWLELQILYNGLCEATRTLLDAAANGSFMKKNNDEAFELLEEMAANAYQWPKDRSTPRKVAGIHELDGLSALTAQVSTLSKQMSQLIQAKAESCNVCGGAHRSGECLEYEQSMLLQSEEANYVGNFNRQNNPFSATYKPGWRNHPNFSWKNDQNIQKPFSSFQQFNQPQVYQQALANRMPLEDILGQFMKSTEAAFQRHETTIQNQSASIHNIEMQLGQLSNLLTSRQQGALPRNTETNPKEHVKAITLRSGKELEEPKRKENESKKLENEVQEPVSDSVKEVKKPKSKLFPDNPPPYIPPIPYPQRLQKQKLDKQFSKFLDVFKKLHINIPFADALEQMPSYCKFMKDILSKKRKLEEYETVALTEECSAILQKKLPPKLKDPGSFTIPCKIGNSSFDKALCDLGASINLMPLSVYKKLGLGEAKPTTISLQMADRSIKYPRGIIEDVLVKVDKFIFPADFIVLDMEKDQDIPLILGRPFLATGRALIDVQKGQLILRVQEEQVTFNVFKAMEHPEDNGACLRVDIFDKCTKGILEIDHLDEPPAASLVGCTITENSDINEFVKNFEAPPPVFIKKPLEDLRNGITNSILSIERPYTLEFNFPPIELSKRKGVGEEFLHGVMKPPDDQQNTLKVHGQSFKAYNERVINPLREPD